MKARVKAKGEIIEVEDCGSVFYQGALFHGYRDNNGNKYMPDELEILFDSDFHPNYWERLKHQYAGMAMQGMLSNPEVDLDYKSDECMPQAVAATAYNIAHALVEKMKEGK